MNDTSDGNIVMNFEMKEGCQYVILFDDNFGEKLIIYVYCAAVLYRVFVLKMEEKQFILKCYIICSCFFFLHRNDLIIFKEELHSFYST